MFHTRVLGLAGALSLATSMLLAGPAAAASAGPRALYLTVPSFDFNQDWVCVDYVCSSTADGVAISNLAGTGTIHWALVTDFFNGWDDACNHVDEVGTFTFATGSITEVSHHTDCALTGLRVKTTFKVVGGTGRFKGVTGGGVELAGDTLDFTYLGVITH